MPNTTKAKILDASINLFNETGLSSVRLQQIADEVGISVGNLAYHYKNKELIIEQVYQQAFSHFKQLLSHFLRAPSLQDFDDQLSAYFSFFQSYRFCFSEIAELERINPKLAQEWNAYLQKLMLQMRQRLDFNVRKGLLVPEPDKGIYDLVANNIWLTCIFWEPKQRVLKKSASEVDFKKAIWSQLSIYLSPGGRAEFSKLSSKKY